MTAEQLEEMVSELAERMRIAYGGQLAKDCTETLKCLARRVIAAEKLVEALEEFRECDCKRHNCATCALFSDADAALTAYREASK